MPIFYLWSLWHNPQRINIIEAQFEEMTDEEISESIADDFVEDAQQPGIELAEEPKAPQEKEEIEETKADDPFGDELDIESTFEDEIEESQEVITAETETGHKVEMTAEEITAAVDDILGEEESADDMPAWGDSTWQ